jgi:hypothetical protein
MHCRSVPDGILHVCTPSYRLKRRVKIAAYRTQKDAATVARLMGDSRIRGRSTVLLVARNNQSGIETFASRSQMRHLQGLRTNTDLDVTGH